MPFRMVYGKKAIMPIEYIIPSLHIVAFTNMVEPKIMEQHLAQLVSLQEDQSIANFHQQVQKAWEKSCHGRHI